MSQAQREPASADWRRFLGGAVGVLLAAWLSTAAWAHPERQLLLDRWNDESGLPQGTVTSITRSDDGYLWVGTFAGLHRFSGERFTEAMAGPAEYASLARITAVHAVGNAIWVGLQDGGVRIYENARYVDPTQPDLLREATVWDIRPDQSGDELLIVASSGVWRHEPGGAWTRIADMGAMAALEAPNGKLWIGNHSGLFEVYADRSSTPVHTDPVYGLSLDPEGGIWATTLHGPIYLDDSGTTSSIPGWEGDMPIGVAPVFDGEGHLWMPKLATMVELGHWATVKAHVASGRALTPMARLDTGPPRSASVDAEGTLWVGTVARGLSRVTTSPYRELPPPSGAPSFSSGPVARAGGHVWHAVDCDQLYGFDGEAWTKHTAIPPLSDHYTRSHCVRTLATSTDGRLLVGTEGYAASTDGEDWTPLDFDGEGLREDEAPTVMRVDDAGALWLGTSSGRLFHAASSADHPLRQVATPPGTPAIFAILTEVPDQLHLGTHDGLRSRIGGEWHTTDCEDGFACGVVRDLARAPDGVIWAATYGGGLGWWTERASGRLERKRHGLPDAFLSSIAFSPDQRQMWLHGNRGLHALDMLELDEVRAGGLQRLHAHRVPLGEANGWARPSQLFEPPNDLWLVTVTGLVHFDLQAMVDRAPAGRVDVLDVQAGPVSIRPDGGVVDLSIENGRDVTIRYSTPVLGPSQLARFRYRLRKASSQPEQVAFSVPTARTEVSYAGLDPGSHVFEVQTVGPEGIGGPVASIDLNVEPEWYEHPLLAVAAVLALVAGLGGLALLRVRSVEARNTTLRREVEARRVVEQRIDEQRQYYRQIFDSAGNAFLLFDARALCVDVNREACNLFAADSQALVGRSPSELGLDGTGAGTGGSHARCKRPDGSTFPARVVTATFSINDQRHFLISVIDLSELIDEREARERLREQLQVARRVEAFGRLAGGVAHDMNNVITAILGYASLLADAARDDPATVEESAHEILQSAHRGSRLVRRMLAFGRHDADSLELLDVSRVLRHLERLLKQLLPEDVELVIRGAPVPTVRLSATGLEQIILNLVVNASDAMPRGGRVSVTVHAEGREVLLTVTDQGTGIPADILEKVFEPFFTTKTAGRGTGLGLATVKDIVEQAGGSLTIDSEVGRGTSVRVRLPAEVAEPAPDPSSLRESSSEPPAVLGAGRRLLVVDDNEHVLKALHGPLTRAGFEVVGFSQPERALAWFLAEKGQVDGIISDVVMPGLNGRQLVDAMHRAHPAVPVLFVSGYTEEVVLRRGVDGNVENLLVKPFSSSELLRQIAGVLGDERQQR